MAQIVDEHARILGSACSMTMGTRDAKLQPHFTRVLGATVHEDREQITIFVPKVIASQGLDDVHDNGRIAIQCVEVGPFKAFQLKGRFVSARDATPAEEELQRAYQARIIEGAKRLGISAKFWQVSIYNPAIAITFRIDESYDQTPGPGAGARVGGG
jgi:hypothetical protein